jgi:hypothetical protein
MRLRRLIALPLIGVLAVGCSDPAAPPTIEATYVLQSVAGNPLPYTIPEDGGTFTVFSASLQLLSNGDAITVERWRRTYPGYDEEQTSTWTFQYRISGENITVGFFTPCPDNASCVANRQGLIRNSTLTITPLTLVPSSPTLYQWQQAVIVD